MQLPWLSWRRRYAATKMRRQRMHTKHRRSAAALEALELGLKAMEALQPQSETDIHRSAED